jgi:hypothetical protein
MQLVIRTDPGWQSRYMPANHVAINLAKLMRVNHFTRSNLNTWLHMSGTVILDGKPYVGG